MHRMPLLAAIGLGVCVLCYGQGVRLEQVEYIDVGTLSYFDFELDESGVLLGSEHCLRLVSGGESRTLYCVEGQYNFVMSIDVLADRVLCVTGNFHGSAILIYDLKTGEERALPGGPAGSRTIVERALWLDSARFLSSEIDPVKPERRLVVVDTDTGVRTVIMTTTQDLRLHDARADLDLMLLEARKSQETEELVLRSISSGAETRFPSPPVYAAVILEDDVVFALDDTREGVAHVLGSGRRPSSVSTPVIGPPKYYADRGILAANVQEKDGTFPIGLFRLSW